MVIKHSRFLLHSTFQTKNSYSFHIPDQYFPPIPHSRPIILTHSTFQPNNSHPFHIPDSYILTYSTFQSCYLFLHFSIVNSSFQVLFYNFQLPFLIFFLPSLPFPSFSYINSPFIPFALLPLIYVTLTSPFLPSLPLPFHFLPIPSLPLPLRSFPSTRFHGF